MVKDECRGRKEPERFSMMAVLYLHAILFFKRKGHVKLQKTWLCHVVQQCDIILSAEWIWYILFTVYVPCGVDHLT